MKRSHIASTVIAACLVSTSAVGGFFIDGSSYLTTERGQMGNHTPHEPRANASFKAAQGDTSVKQDRYKDAELLVDLAYTPVTQKGSGDAALVPGFADGVPFDTSMAMILPAGWQMYKSKTLDAKHIPENISFSGGKPWPELLSQVGDRYELHFHIDWYDHTVVMSKGRESILSKATNIKVINEAPQKPQIVSAKSLPAVGASSVVKVSPLPQIKLISANNTINANPKTANLAPAQPVVPVKVSAPIVKAQPVIPIWSLLPSDRTLREALKGWANLAGWTFEPEHWAAQVDIPVTAKASFSGDFKDATRQLIGTTELGETPLQPCFYSNRVVRVVPINQMCDPAAGR